MLILSHCVLLYSGFNQLVLFSHLLNTYIVFYKLSKSDAASQLTFPSGLKVG